MDVNELSRFIGDDSRDAKYLPVAFLLKTGYACYGYYNSALNDGLSDLCVLLNVRLMDLSTAPQSSRNTIRDFSDFLQDVVVRAAKADSDSSDSDDALSQDRFGKAIPISAVSLSEIALVYPVAQIGKLLRRSGEEQGEPVTSSLLDFEKSEILALLLTKIW